MADGNPWDLADIFASKGKTLTDAEWHKNEPYCKSKLIQSVQAVTEGVDSWLLSLGYQREGEYYRVVGKETAKTVAMFSHGGSSTAALSHILNIPFPQLCGIVHLNYTSITVIEFSDKVGNLFCPRILILNDAKHIKGLDTIKKT